MPFYRCVWGGKTSTAIKLGSGAGTYNLSKYKGYEKFEINKNIFIIPSNASFNGPANDGSQVEFGHGYPYLGGSFSNPSANYDASTGILTVSNGVVSSSYSMMGGSGSSFNKSASIGCKVYLVY